MTAKTGKSRIVAEEMRKFMMVEYLSVSRLACLNCMKISEVK
jgi:hypothetical protein